MSDTELAEPRRIPSAWLVEHRLSDAMQFLAQHPDILDDEDIALALDSEQPDIARLTNAFVAAAISAEDVAEAAKQRASTLRERAARMEQRAEQLRDQLADILTSLGMRRIETPSGLVSLRTQRGRVVVTEPDILPAEYWRERSETSPDKEAIGAALRNNVAVPGATISNARLMVRIST